MPLGIVFDCDGTLVDTEPMHYLSWQKALEKHGRFFSIEECSCLSGLSGLEIAKKLDPIHYESILRDKRFYYKEMQKRQVPPIERMVKFVFNLYARKDELNLKMAVASAAHKEEIWVNLKHIGLDQIFSFVISGQSDLHHFQDPEGVNKPKPYIYLHAAYLLGLAPHQCVAFEDTSAGVLAATTAGFFTFAVPNVMTEAQDFSKADCIIERESEFTIDIFLNKISQYHKDL